MTRFIAALVATVFSIASVNVWAGCSDDKASDDRGGMSTPNKPSA